jgi:hypothetical protein
MNVHTHRANAESICWRNGMGEMVDHIHVSRNDDDDDDDDDGDDYSV